MYGASISNAEIKNFFDAHLGDQAAIEAAMAEYGISDERVAEVTGWHSAQTQQPEQQPVALEQSPSPVEIANVSDADILTFYQAHAGDAAALNAAMTQYGVSAERVTKVTGWRAETAQAQLAAPVSDADIKNFLQVNAGDEAAITAAMAQYGVSADRVVAIMASQTARLAVSDADIKAFVQANADNDVAIVIAMAEYGVSAARLATAIGLDIGQTPRPTDPVSDTQVKTFYQEHSGDQAAIAAAMTQYGVSPERLAALGLQAPTVAVSDADIANYYTAHAGDDAAIVNAMATYGVNADRVAAVIDSLKVSDADIKAFVHANAGDEVALLAAMAKYGVSVNRLLAVLSSDTVQATPAAPVVTAAEISNFIKAHANDPVGIGLAMDKYGVSGRRLQAVMGCMSEQELDGIWADMDPRTRGLLASGGLTMAQALMAQRYSNIVPDPERRLGQSSRGWDDGPRSAVSEWDMAIFQVQQDAYTRAHSMSREDFLRKYGKTFVASDQGGNAASEVAGRDVAAYYDTYLAPGAKTTMSTGTGGDGDGYSLELPITWGDGKYSREHPFFDAWDNVNPHPESQMEDGFHEAWKQVGRPMAMMAAAYLAAPYLAEMVSTAATGTAALEGGNATLAALHSAAGYGTVDVAATGLAGTLGMNAGYVATAFNTGAFNTAMALVRGQGLEDALKSGLSAAFLSPIGNYVGDITGGGYRGLIASNTALGGLQAAISGKDVGDGLSHGLVNGLVSVAGSYVGAVTKSVTQNDLASNVASTLTQSALKGQNGKDALEGLAVDLAVDYGLTLASGVVASTWPTVDRAPSDVNLMSDPYGDPYTDDEAVADAVREAGRSGNATHTPLNESDRVADLYDLNGSDIEDDRQAGLNYRNGSDLASDQAGTPAISFRPSDNYGGANGDESVAGRGVKAKAGASISKLLGTSDPQAVGNFMRANNLNTSTLKEGVTYFVPESTVAYGDQTALGQATLNQDNARIAALNEARAREEAAKAQSSSIAGFGDQRDARDIRSGFEAQANSVASAVPILRAAAEDFAAKAIQAYNSGDKVQGDKYLGYASQYYKAASDAQESANNLSNAAYKFQLPPAAAGRSNNVAGVFSPETLTVPFAAAGNTADTALTLAGSTLLSANPVAQLVNLTGAGDKVYSTLSSWLAPLGAKDATDTALSFVLGRPEAHDMMFGAMEERKADRSQWANPDNKEQSAMARFAGMVATVPMNAILAPATPVETGTTLIDKGESLGVASIGVAAQGTVVAATMLIPGAVGTSTLARAASGAATNVIWAEAAAQTIVWAADRPESKQQFATTVESQLGNGFLGAVTGVATRSPRAPEPRLSAVEVPALEAVVDGTRGVGSVTIDKSISGQRALFELPTNEGVVYMAHSPDEVPKFVVLVDAKQFEKLWVSDPFRSGWARSVLESLGVLQPPARSSDYKFHYADDGFSGGKKSPVDVSEISVELNMKGDYELLSSDGVTRTNWLLEKGASRIPFSVRSLDAARTLQEIAGVGEPILRAENREISEIP